MIHLYRSIQRDVFADYLDHAAERVVEELINRAVGDFEMDQEDRHLISRYYKCVFVGVILDWLRLIWIMISCQICISWSIFTRRALRVSTKI